MNSALAAPSVNRAADRMFVAESSGLSGLTGFLPPKNTVAQLCHT